MKKFLFIALVGILLLPGSAAAQTQPQPTISPLGEDCYQMTWLGISARTYFIQMSQDLVTWTYAPCIEYGTGADLIWGVECGPPKHFFRLKYTDAPVPNGDPGAADFDGDGITNLDEVENLGTDPFVSDDTDGDGLLNSQESTYLTSPIMADTDGDGASDYEEILEGTGPLNDAQQPFDAAHPPAKADLWVDDDAVIPPGASMDGSSDFPYDTLASAISVSAAGDVIAVRRGEYVWAGEIAIAKDLRIIGVDGPIHTFFKLAADAQFVISNPAAEITPPAWTAGLGTLGPEMAVGQNPTCVEFYGLRFSSNYTGQAVAPLFFQLPQTKVVLSQCYFRQLQRGLADVHSGELLLLGSQVAECGHQSSTATLPLGILRLRGKSLAKIWHASALWSCITL